MKFFNFFLGCTLFCCVTLFGADQEKPQILNPSFLKLLEVTEVSHDGSLGSIIEGTQKKWLRPAGMERWQIPEIAPEKRNEVVKLAKELGLIDEKSPMKMEYDYCLILGCTVEGMRVRLNYAKTLWDRGVRFKSLVFLTGERPIDRSIEKISDEYETESDASHFLWREIPSDAEMKQLPMHFVSVPMITDARGVRRANTIDTVIAWLETHPKPGSTLFISNQPYCIYQNEAIASCLPKEFSLETVGPAAKKENPTNAILLDTLARILWWESSVLDKKLALKVSVAK